MTRLLACPLFLVLIAAQAIATPPTDWAWQNPLPQGNHLEAVWGRAAADVYAIGGDQTLLHWDGAAWSVADRPQSMPIVDMCGLADGSLFACGWYGAVLRFDGAAWTGIPIPGAPSLKAILAFSQTEIYVAETYPGQRIWRYDGATWHEIGTAPDGIHDLGGSGPDDIYAVGFYGMMTHWDGAAWTPVPGFDGIDLTSVWSNAADDVFALGQGALLYHFDGIDWTQVGSDTSAAWASDMWGTSFTNLWFVDENGGVSHFDGDLVTEYDVPSDGFLGVWGDGLGQVHAVGPSGSLATFDGATWTSHATAATTEKLLAIHRVGPDEAYAGGFLESAIRWDGESWTSIRDTAFNVWFTDIWAAGSNDVFFVGKAGIQHWNGVDWTFMDDGLRHLLLTVNGVWGFGPDDAVAVADWGAIVRYDGLAWSVVREPDSGQGNLSAVWGAAPDDIWAVGPADEYLHWDGIAWTPVPVPAASGAKHLAVHGWSGSDVWFLAEGGELRHWNGSEWTVDEASFPGTALTGLHGQTPADLHVVSYFGTVWHYDGGAWVMADSGARTGLNTIWADGGGVWVAGWGGSVLHGTGGVTAVPEFVAGAPLGVRCAPNPFNPSTDIQFDLPRGGHVRLTIHDALGRRVATLVDGMRQAGPQVVVWDGRDAGGRPSASGVYLVQVQTDGSREARKVSLVK